MARGREAGTESTDRWSRKDWWGVVLEAPDPGVLARFYSELLGWPIWSESDDGAALDVGQGVGYLAIQRNPDYVRPAWPDEPGQQRMMMHLDFEVSDLAAATEHALELAGFQPQDDVRVLLDPAGHPFCLYT